MFRALLLAVLLACTGIAGAVPAATYDLDSSHSEVAFSVRLGGLTTVRGRFNSAAGTAVYDEQDPTRSSITVAIRTASIDTGLDERDNHLRAPDFFDSEKFPVVLFRSSAIESNGNGYTVRGTLAIRGTERSIAIPIQLVHKKAVDPFGNDRVGFRGTLTLSRGEFGVTGPRFWSATISDGVTIELNISLRAWNWDRINGTPAKGKKSLSDLLPVFEQQGLKAGTNALRGISDEYDRSARQFQVLAMKLAQHSKLAESIAVLEAGVEQNPDSDGLHALLGEQYSRTGAFSRARAAYQKALHLEPYNTRAFEGVRQLPADPVD